MMIDDFLSIPNSIRDRNYNHIHNEISNTIVSGTSGDDSIKNGDFEYGNRIFANFVTINGGAGNDYIYNCGHNAFIDVKDGNDFIYNMFGYNATINSGDGNDCIFNSNSHNVIINSGTGCDSIKNWYGNNLTINGGADDDFIDIISDSFESNEVIQYANGDGNDIINGYNSHDTIRITSGGINNAKLDGKDVVIKIGDGSIRLNDAKGTPVTIIDSSDQTIKFTNTYQGIGSNTDSSGGNNNTLISSDDEFMNTPDNGTINGTTYADTISNSGKNVWINGLDGDDVIKNYIISTTSYYPLPKYGTNSTINAGTGNDTVYAQSTDHIAYASGDGNDVVYGNPVIHLTSGKLKNASRQDKDVILYFDNGQITLKDNADKTVSLIKPNGSNIYFSNNYSANYYGRGVGVGNTITAGFYDDYIGESITGFNG